MSIGHYYPFERKLRGVFVSSFNNRLVWPMFCLVFSCWMWKLSDPFKRNKANRFRIDLPRDFRWITGIQVVFHIRLPHWNSTDVFRLVSQYSSCVCLQDVLFFEYLFLLQTWKIWRRNWSQQWYMASPELTDHGRKYWLLWRVYTGMCTYGE